MKKIAIYGAGGFGKEVQALIEHINADKITWEFIGFFDDGIEKGTLVNKKPVLGGLTDLIAQSDIGIIIALGSPKVKEKILNNILNLESKYYFPILIHPQAVLPIDATLLEIGEGTVVTAGCVISVNSKIGKHVLINVNTTIGHDVEIDDFCSIMPGCKISGEVSICSSCFIGVGTIIINQILISNNCTIGAGSVVLKSVQESFVTIMGNPARIVLKNNI